MPGSIDALQNTPTNATSTPERWALQADSWIKRQLGIKTEQNANRNAASTQLRCPILITDISTQQTDLVSVMSCLNNVKVMYTFGQMMGNVTIRGNVLLGPLGSVQSDGVARLDEWYNTYRVSVYKKPISFCIGGRAFKMFLTGMAYGAADPELNILPFGAVGTFIDPKNEDTQVFNPDNSIVTQASAAATAPVVLTPSVANDNKSMVDALVTEGQAQAAVSAAYTQTYDKGLAQWAPGLEPSYVPYRSSSAAPWAGKATPAGDVVSTDVVRGPTDKAEAEAKKYEQNKAEQQKALAGLNIKRGTSRNVE